MVLGILLIVAFVPWALARRNIHPLIELRLFKNRNMTVAVLAMMLFAIAFFGASLLFPLYFIQVRGESALGAGLLLAPQGVGAMMTMPIAGILADKIGPGKIVLTGIAVITVGMAMFTQIGADTSYPYMLGALFMMGLGMGATMMPIMTAALATLTAHNVARGSTLLNITQQVAASMGTALFSVILTNQINGSDTAPAYLAAAPPTATLRVRGARGAVRTAARQFTALVAQGQVALADSFATVFIVATLLVACCLIPAWFLPRKQVARGRPGRDDGSLTSRTRPVLTAAPGPPVGGRAASDVVLTTFAVVLRRAVTAATDRRLETGAPFSARWTTCSGGGI